MDKTELYELIAGGEDSVTEFKRDISQRSDFAGEMIALANVDGGLILERLATPHERARLLQSAGWVHFDEMPVFNTGLEDLDKDAFSHYFRRIFESPLDEADVPFSKMLTNMRFLVPDIDGQLRLSVAGLLLFGRAPQEFMYHLGYVNTLGSGIPRMIRLVRDQAGRDPDFIVTDHQFLVRLPSAASGNGK